MKQEPKNQGFITLKRSFFNVRFNDPTASVMSYDEAWIRLALHVNHSTGSVTRDNRTFLCGKGESMMLLSTWAKLFGWTRYRTRRFFRVLEEQKLVETKIIERRFFVRILNYAEWTCRKPKDEAEVKKEDEEQKKYIKAFFLHFWELYHEITHMPKIDRSIAWEIWKTIPEKDYDRIVDHIPVYMERRLMTMTSYNKTAKMYLKEKCYIL